MDNGTRKTSEDFPALQHRIAGAWEQFEGATPYWMCFTSNCRTINDRIYWTVEGPGYAKVKLLMSLGRLPGEVFESYDIGCYDEKGEKHLLWYFRIDA